MGGRAREGLPGQATSQSLCACPLSDGPSGNGVDLAAVCWSGFLICRLDCLSYLREPDSLNQPQADYGGAQLHGQGAPLPSPASLRQPALVGIWERAVFNALLPSFSPSLINAHNLLCERGWGAGRVLCLPWWWSLGGDAADGWHNTVAACARALEQHLLCPQIKRSCRSASCWSP